MRHDKRVSVGGIPDFVRSYVFNISQKYPYWNRTGGTDHFYLACHSIGRKNLAFFAGAINSPVRKKLLEVWKNDSKIYVHFGRLPTPYSDELLGCKFFLHVKGFEVNTARIGDALY
ncbi:hypothetical protein IFM89_004194 [Coptis chinensis]|uniref:Exostosin GT47 domain-containing protein n=1 Tax=Coptis chinensis TaxID=261450 RepID=A0A835LKG5_9MAGN|nr:hypothetical protein IFM89_004194 [Coptis chinensis]